METKTHTAAGTPLMKLVEHFAQFDHKDGNPLSESEWVVVEDFSENRVPTYKVLGEDENGKFISGPVELFEKRGFAGIVYYDKTTATKGAREMTAKYKQHNMKFLAFNPIRNIFV